MKRNFSLHAGSGLLAGVVMLGLMWSPLSALAATLTGTTTVSFSSNPVTLVAGNDVTITTTTTTTPTNATLISAGKVVVEYSALAGVPVPAGTAGAS